MRGEVVMVSPLFAAFVSENKRHVNIAMTARSYCLSIIYVKLINFSFHITFFWRT